MDGTFAVAPHPFKQLYTIRVLFKDVTGTAVYAFLPNKCQDRGYRIVRLGFSSRGSKAWTLSSHWDTTWVKIWLGLSLVLVAKSFMAFLVFEYLMLVSLGA
jgi:hypothetical protein